MYLCIHSVEKKRQNWLSFTRSDVKVNLKDTALSYLGLNKWQPTPVFLPGESLEQRCLTGYSIYGCKESDTAEAS